MGSRRRPFFDLNQPPSEEEDSEVFHAFQSLLHGQAQAQPLPQVQVEAQPLPRVQDQAQPLPRVQDQAQPLPRVQDQAQPLLCVQAQAQPLPHVQAQIQPPPHVQAQAQPLPHVQAHAQTSPQVHYFQAPFFHSLSDRLSRIPNEHSFSHAPFVSGFQPFVRSKEVQNVQELTAQDSTVYCSGWSKVLSSQDKVALNSSSHYAVSESTVDEQKPTASVLNNDPGVSSANISPFQPEVAVVKSSSELRDEQMNDREEGEWSDKEDTIEPSCKTEVDTCAGDDAGSNGSRPILESKAEEAVEKGLDDSSVFEGGFDLSIEKIESDKKAVLDSNKSKELDKDLKCEELENLGKPDDIHISTKPSSSDKSYEDDSKKNATYDGLDDVKEEAPPGSVQLNSSIKSAGLGVLNKPKGVKGQHESKFASCLGNKRKVDEQMEAKLGKKRNRQTMFLNLEDVKRAGAIKTPTSKRQSSVQSPSCNLPRESHRSSHAAFDGSVDKQGLLNNKDQRQADSSSSEGGGIPEFQDHKRTDYISEDSPLTQMPSTEKTLRGNVMPWSKRMNCNMDPTVEGLPPPIPRQSSWKQGSEQKHGKGQQLLNQKSSVVSGPARESLDQRPPGKKHVLTSKKQGLGNASYQDASIERLHREVTSEKFWHHPG